MKKVAIIEDDIVFGTMLNKWLLKNGYSSTLCIDLNQGKELLNKQKVDLVICDMRLPDGEDTELLQWARENNIVTPFIMMTSYAQVQNAVESIKLGAEDYLEKPVNPELLKQKLNSVFSKTIKQDIVNKIGGIKEPSIKNEIVIGESPAAKLTYDYIIKVAPTKLSILILGESGTGKEYAANLIHTNSNRKDKPFVAVDCGSLSKELAASELFGHKKGSFTSAVEDKIGVFEQANGGTVFLDGVGNLSYDVQIQLLRALQEQKIRPVGSTKDKAIDLRILAATNEDLNIAIANGKFREDLYHRLDEFTLTLPPLRERKEDIKLFINTFIEQSNKELDKYIDGITPKALNVLKEQYWSGNLRELKNVIRRAVLFADGNLLDTYDLPNFEQQQSPSNINYGLQPQNEVEQIKEALRITRGSKSKAAAILKIDRKTLYNKLAQYGLE